jgi:hypothetical protein
METLEDWLNQLSISRKVLLCDDISKVGCIPRYELDMPVRRNLRRNARILACSIDGEQLLCHHAPPYMRVPINFLSIPAKIDHKPPDQCSEFYLASLLADEENKRLVWMCKHGAKRERIRCPLSPAVLNTTFKMIEQYDCIVEHVVISPTAIETLRDFGDDFFGEPRQEQLKYGTPASMQAVQKRYVLPDWHLTKGHIWCADVMQTAWLKPNQFMVFARRDTVGPLVQEKAPYIYSGFDPKGNICVHVGHALINPHLCIFAEIML